MLWEYDFGVQFFCWYCVLSKKNAIPISDGSLDRAMKEAIDQKGISDRISKSLNFSDTRIGLRCVELPALEQVAINALIIEPQPPEYIHDKFSITSKGAKKILERENKTSDMRYFVSNILQNLQKYAS